MWIYFSVTLRVSRKGTRDIRNPEAFLIRTARREIARHHRREGRHDALPAETALPAQPALAAPSSEDGVVA
ncbi:MAG: hypothetical protein HDQ87_01410 [Clostridia bacterium]|nr:hypothetical protein [Clostridia bacterium]